MGNVGRKKSLVSMPLHDSRVQYINRVIIIATNGMESLSKTEVAPS